MSMSTQRSALDGILPDLVRYLNLSHIRRHLKQAGQLTDDEYEQLEVAPSNPTGTAIDRLVWILKRKAPEPEYVLLQALRRSMEVTDPHSGHTHLINMLEKEIAKCSGYHGNTPTRGSPVHHYVYDLTREGSPNDSGISRDSTSTGSRSSTVSPSSLPNGSGLTRSYEEYRVGPLENKFEGGFQPRQLESKAPLGLAKFELFEGSKQDRRELESCRVKVARDSEEIIGRFAKLVLAVYRLLVQLEVDLEEVRMVVLFMGCCRGGTSQEQIRMFNDTCDIAQARNLCSLIQSLRNYSSWFNYRLIKFVAEEFGREDGKKLIGVYEDELKQYFETVIAYQCPQFSLADGIPDGYEQLEVKVAWDYRSCLVQDVVLFQATLSDLLGLEPHVFQLKSLEEGCVLFTWAVPAAVAPHIVTEVCRHTKELAQVPVKHVSILRKFIVITAPSPIRIKEKPVTRVTKQPFESDSRPEEKDWPGLRTLTVTTSSGSTASASSFSTVSELTSSTSKRSSQLDDEAVRRTSQLSQLIDLAETADEVEIVSNYSGISGHGVSSSSLIGLTSRLSDEFMNVSVETTGSGGVSPLRTEESPPVKSKPYSLSVGSSRKYHSEGDLLELTPTIAHPPNRRVRAMSEDLLQVDDLLDTEAREANKSCHRRRRPSIFRSPIKWIPHLFRPFRKRRCVTTETLGTPPSSPSSPSSPPSSSFHILPLSTEPQSGLHYYQTETDTGEEESWRNSDPPGTMEPLPSIPEVVINPSPTGIPKYHLQSGSTSQALSISEVTPGFATSGVVIHNRSHSQDGVFLQPFLTIPASTSGSSSRSNSPSSTSSGFGGSVYTTSNSASPSSSSSPRLRSQLSEETEGDLSSPVSYCTQRPPIPRIRANSAPYKLHGVRRKASMTRTYEESSRNKTKRNHSTTASDYRSVTPDNPMSRKTSDYFSTSDVTGTLTPETPLSQFGSQSISEVSFVVTPPVQRKQFPECMPVRRHSLNSRSRYQTRPKTIPLAASASSHSNGFGYEPSQ